MVGESARRPTDADARRWWCTVCDCEAALTGTCVEWRGEVRVKDPVEECSMRRCCDEGAADAALAGAGRSDGSESESEDDP
mmetsp:Transcript_8690/g.27716  ORF Transcript_8690/g.27716 Transcript_8690/m.27716 type:complete len:81 (+) Transcript_8690:652-894(+)